MTFSPRATLKSSSHRAVLGLIAGATLWLGANAARAEEVATGLARAKEVVGLTGSWRAAGFQEDKNFSEDENFAVGGLWLNARPEELWGVKSYLDFRLQGQDLGRDFYSDGDLREAYVETSFGAVDVRVGRQILVWGRADKVNPTDVWSMRNFRLLATDDEDQRTGIFTTQVAYNFENYRLIAVWQPEWRGALLPIRPQDGVEIKAGNPDGKTAQFGLKLDHSGGSVDWSLSFSQVIDKLPDLDLLSAQPNLVRVSLNHQKLQVVGGDAAFVMGEYGVRAEAAYTRTEDSDGRDPFTKNSFVFAVLGADRTFDGVLNVNVQYLYKNVLGYQDLDSLPNAAIRPIADQVNWIANQQAAVMHGASARISHKAFNETLETELAVVTWFNNNDSLIRPKVTYAFSDTWRGVIGGEFFNGPFESFFGRLKPTSGAFMELRWLF